MIRRLMLALLVCFAAAARPAAAQVLQGEWVDQSQQKIEQVRMSPVRIIVLDAEDAPVAGASVRIEQQTHHFTLGFTVSSTEWPAADPAAVVWRSFNGVSLDRITDWPVLAPTRSAFLDVVAIEELLIEAQRRGMRTRWGGVISADVGRLPSWVPALEGAELAEAIEGHLQQVVKIFGGQIDQFDVYTNALDHHFVQDRLGVPMLRRLYEQAQAISPRTSMAVRFTDAFDERRLEQMLQLVAQMRQDFIPVDAVALEQRIVNPVVQAPLARAIAWLDRADLDVQVVNLEVGGVSEAAAALNLETVLRTLFAEPAVEGIWFAPITPEAAAVPNAALVNKRGRPTAPGKLFNALFRELWWTDETFTTDELGNVTTRVFAGSHRVTATLSDGSTLSTMIHVPPSDDPRIVVLEPLK